MKFLEKNRATILRIFGVIIFIITCHSLYTGSMAWAYEGLIAMSVSVLMVWMPESLAKLILGIIQKLTKKLLGNQEPPPAG